MLQQPAQDEPAAPLEEAPRREAVQTSMLQQLAQESGAAAAELSNKAREQLTETRRAHEEAEAALHDSTSEGEMLRTAVLENNENLLVIQKLAETVQKMKAQWQEIERQEMVCRKRVADLKNGEYERAEDSALANSVDV